MPYRYFDDIALADAAFEAWGDSLEELLVAAADATINVMVDDLESVRPRVQLSLALGPEEADMLLYALLQELVYYKDAEQLLLRIAEVRLTKGDEGYSLRCMARGEKLDPGRHALAADVKAVTMHRFAVTKTGEGWHAFVILDI